MATSGTPQPDPMQSQGGPSGPSSGPPSPSPNSAPPTDPSQGMNAPADPKQIALAQMYQLCMRLAQEDPVLSGGLQKAADGIQEAQTAMVTQPQPQPVGSNPSY